MNGTSIYIGYILIQYGTYESNMELNMEQYVPSIWNFHIVFITRLVPTDAPLSNLEQFSSADNRMLVFECVVSCG